MWIKEIYLLYRYSIVDSIRIHDNKLLLDARKQDTRLHLDIWPKTHISNPSDGGTLHICLHI